MSNHRAAVREARVQQRVKARLDAWWHTTQCPNCQAKLALLSTLQEAIRPKTEDPLAKYRLN